MFVEIAFFLIVLVSCVICGRAMATPRSSSAAHRVPAAKYRGEDEWGSYEPPMKPLPKWRPFKLEASVIVCSCSQPNQPDAEACWSCNRALASAGNQTITLEAAERCAVCAYWIYPADRVAVCPACKAQGHYAHVFEYIKARGQCPRCSRKLIPSQLLVATTFHDKPVDAVLTESATS